jgi:quercetin dioxygenase-like cupin family protein
VRTVGTAESDGTVFRIVQYAPGVAPRHHRTNSIDYAVVVSGSIDMDLDNQTVRLTAGDVLVQRGTMHNWVNNGTEPCLIAFVLIGAAPVTVNGAPLPAVG